MVGEVGDVVGPYVGAKLVDVRHGGPCFGAMHLVFEVLWCVMCVLEPAAGAPVSLSVLVVCCVHSEPLKILEYELNPGLRWVAVSR